jgi:hypothetical protein
MLTDEEQAIDVDDWRPTDLACYPPAVVDVYERLVEAEDPRVQQLRDACDE